MRKYIIILICLVLYLTAFSQNFVNIVTKNTANTTGGEIVAGQCVILQPGFSFTATSGKSLHVYINEQMAIRQENTAVSNGKNYITTVTPLDATLTASFNNGQLNVSGNARALVDIQYFDGLGRPEELVMRGITPDKADLVALQEYDGAGRESKQWLPTAKSSNNGAFVSKTEAKNNSMYGGYPYNETVYENSPLNRVNKQFGAGSEWRSDGDKAVVTEYMSNTASSDLLCPLLEATETGLRYTRNYAANELYVTKTTDESGKISYTFTDKLGQLIMTKQSSARTCYVYDNFGNLAYVLSPMATNLLGSNITYARDNQILKNYAYMYKYDERNRCIEKKLPGADWIYYVYDKADRLILSQDGNQRTENSQKWTFYKYDELGRLTVSGTFINPTPKSRAELAIQCKNYLVIEAASSTGPGYFANKQEILLKNYYDAYDNVYPSFREDDNYDTQYAVAKGLLTGTWVKVLNDVEVTGNFYGGDDEKFTSYYYDNKGHVIQKGETSLVKFDPFTYGGGRAGDVPMVHYNYQFPKDKYEFYKYSFTGKVLQKKISYGSYNYGTIDEQYRYEYDHADRLTKTWHKILDKPEILMSKLEYDDWGRVWEKQLHNGLETTLYNHNIRGWIEEIFSENNRFHEYLNYDYNGNISSFNSGNDQDDYEERGYDFEYDALNRLSNAHYLGDGYRTGAYEGFSENLTYDLNGNIKGIFRKTAETGWGVGVGLAERSNLNDLTFNYSGNQVVKITDNVTWANSSYRSQAFQQGSALDIQYLYDQNGNMTADDNKGIAKIKYNFLNLPDSILFRRGGHLIHNVYDAAGTKHIAEYKTGVGDVNIPLNSTTNVSDWSFAHTEYKHYNGNLRYTTMEYDLTSMRLLTDEGYVDFEIHGNSYLTGNVKYYYNLHDHLGSVRYTFDEDGENAGFTHYYPFGMEFIKYDDIPGVPGKEKYTGKELQADFGLNLYDYGWRNYDMATGRFTAIDPMAEKYYSVSPYAYCGNNPVKFIDLDGRDAVIAIYGNQITVSANVYLYGAGATNAVMSQYQSDVNAKWGGTYSATSANGTSFDVSVNVNFSLYGGKEKNSPTIISESWNPFNRDNFVEVGANDKRSYVQGGDEGVWRSQGRNGMTLSQDNPAPHEVGHLLGLGDRYTDKGGVNTGWEGNIMGESRTGNVEQRNIDGILKDAMKAYDKWIQNPKNEGKEFRYEINTNSPNN